MKVSAVIPCYNNYHLTHSVLMDVYKQFPQDTEVIVVDDCSTEEKTKEGLIWWKKNMFVDRMEIHVNEENRGFLRTANYGVSQTHNEIVCLISNDVQIKSNPCPEITQIFDSGSKPVLAGKTLYNYNTGWNTFGDVIFPYLDGSFLAFRKKEWDEFGGFDERYMPFDFEDVDISSAYLRAGGKLVSLGADIIHLGAQTNQYSPEREAQTKRNQEKFKNKWLK